MLRCFKERYKRLDKWYMMSDSYEKERIGSKQDSDLSKHFNELSERDKLQAVLDLEVEKMDKEFIRQHIVTTEMNNYRINRDMIQMSI